MTTPTDFRALCAELVEKLDELNCNFNVPSQSALIDRATTALAQPEPVGPTDEELVRVYQAAYQPAWDRGEFHGCHVDGLRAVLARWGRPAIDPIPVSERLPGPEDCDAEGMCWWFSPEDPGVGRFGVAACWVLRQRGEDDDWLQAWLPHYALPVPQQEPSA